jgi:SAM-dependent methyltransferase
MSAVVANCAMNRERQLVGVNSYARELGFNPLQVVSARTGSGGRGQDGTVAWLDLCCGSGRALIQAARQVRDAGLAGRVDLVGVDLVDAFDAAPGSVPGLELVCAPVAAWEPARSFDLITCVHGLHYVGDKLALLTRAAGWLAPAGRLTADLDLSAIRVGGPAATWRLRSRLRAAGFAYSPGRRQITCAGRRDVRLPSALTLTLGEPAHSSCRVESARRRGTPCRDAAPVAVAARGGQGTARLRSGRCSDAYR